MKTERCNCCWRDKIERLWHSFALKSVGRSRRVWFSGWLSLVNISTLSSLQCLDTVHSVTGRLSSLQKASPKPKILFSAWSNSSKVHWLTSKPFCAMQNIIPLSRIVWLKRCMLNNTRCYTIKYCIMQGRGPQWLSLTPRTAWRQEIVALALYMVPLTHAWYYAWLNCAT